MYRDGARKSIWQQEVDIPSEPLPPETFDVAIIGAGITGVTCAIRLMEAGKKIILLEASNPGFGTTGGTTAHINTFFDASYDQVIKDFGLEKARLLARAGKEAIKDIQSNIDNYGIDCSFEEKAGFIFALDDVQKETLEKMREASNEAGVQMEYSHNSPFPIPHVKAVRVDHQAQFHPLQYINGLLQTLQKKLPVISHCRVMEVEPLEESLLVKTDLGSLHAHHVIYATHTPPGVNILHFRNAPYRSYVLAAKLKSEYPDALGYDLDEPYHYYRTQEIEGEKFLIAGGEDHKTGHEEDTGKRFAALENYVRSYFDVDKIVYSWSSQYYESADGLPYIGKLPGGDERIFVATGYTGNGITFGTVAGKVISDLIVHQKSEYEELFNPSRVKPIAGFTNFVKEGADVIASFVKDKIFVERLHSKDEIIPGEAKTYKYEGSLLAIYKDERGKIHALNSACPHVNCNVHWNSAEKTWDCPCHGSRFGINGKMLNAPSVKDLKQIEIPDVE